MLYVPNYACALRCIGQALQNQHIEICELKAEGNEFRLECGDPNPPYTAIIRLSYSLDRLKILDRDGQARRAPWRSEVRFDSIPERLRAIGHYVDNKRARLRRLNIAGLSDQPDIELDCETRAGEMISETLTMGFVRETAVCMYKRRARVSNPVDMLTRGRKL